MQSASDFETDLLESVSATIWYHREALRVLCTMFDEDACGWITKKHLQKALLTLNKFVDEADPPLSVEHVSMLVQHTKSIPRAAYTAKVLFFSRLVSFFRFSRQKYRQVRAQSRSRTAQGPESRRRHSTGNPVSQNTSASSDKNIYIYIYIYIYVCIHTHTIPVLRVFCRAKLMLRRRGSGEEGLPTTKEAQRKVGVVVL